MLGSIPSPSSGALSIGPLSIHAYGLMIALGVVAAVWLMGRRLEASGAGTKEDVSSMAVWAVIAGVIGARLYHVVTDWSAFRDDPARIIQIWKGGLGIPGGMLLGAIVGVWAIKRRGVDPARAMTAAAPALPLAQAIGRWGNWWNQELYGKPTTLPWALRIDNVPEGYPAGTTFHPTFLYESLWNLALCALLLWIDRRFKLRPGRLLAVYVLGYGIGRFWVEGLRIDLAKRAGGLRLNQWMAIVIAVTAALYLVLDWLRHRGVVAAPATADPSAVDDDTDVDADITDELAAATALEADLEVTEQDLPESLG
jgi:prolipoprotein diacylglyceryl transferase